MKANLLVFKPFLKHKKNRTPTSERFFYAEKVATPDKLKIIISRTKPQGIHSFKTNTDQWTQIL